MPTHALPGQPPGHTVVWLAACPPAPLQVSKSPKIVVEKSTVPVKTGETLKRVLNAGKGACVRAGGWGPGTERPGVGRRAWAAWRRGSGLSRLAQGIGAELPLAGSGS